MAASDGRVPLYNKHKPANKILACAAVVDFPARGPDGPGQVLVSPSQAAYLLKEYAEDVTADRSEAMSGLKIYRASFSSEQYAVLPKLSADECAAGVKLLSAGEEAWDVKENSENQLRTRLAEWMSGPQRDIGVLPVHPADKALKDAAAKIVKQKEAAVKVAQAAIAQEAKENAEAEAKKELEEAAAKKAAEEAKSEDATEEVAVDVAVTPEPEHVVEPAAEYEIVKVANGKYKVVRTDTGEKVHEKQYLKKNSAEALCKRLRADHE